MVKDKKLRRLILRIDYQDKPTGSLLPTQDDIQGHYSGWTNP